MKRLSNLLLIMAMIAMTACSGSGQKQDDSEKATQNLFPEEELAWKLGAQAYTFRLFTFEEALNKIDSAGLRHVEIYPGQPLGAGSDETMGHKLSVEGRALVNRLLKEKNIQANAYGVVDGTDDTEWEEIFTFAQDLGIRTIVCEPKEEHLDKISDLCDEYDILAAIHNHPDPSHYWDPDVVIQAFEGRSFKIGAGADVGHWIRSGLDPIECLQKLDGRVYHIHFKDLNIAGEKQAHDVHWGTGVLGLTQVIEELKRQHFEGMISAEYEYNWENNMPDVKTSVENFRKAL